LVLLTLSLSGSACYKPYQPSGDSPPFNPGGLLDDDDSGVADDDDSSIEPGDDDSAGDDDDSAGDDDDSAGDDDDSAHNEVVLAPPDTCPCGFGQICEAGLCQYVDTLAVGLLEAANAADPEIPSGSACFWNPAFLGSVIAREGNCYVRVLPTDNPTEPHLEKDAGWITITGGETDPIQFSSSGPSDCLNSNITPGVSDLFVQDEVLQFSSGGGTDFPSFTAALVAPAPVEGAPGTVQVGQAMTAAWVAASSDFVELVLSTEDAGSGYAYAAVCRVPDTGAASIPATITAFLPEQNTGWQVTISRNRVEHLEYPSLGVVIEAVLQTSRVFDDGS